MTSISAGDPGRKVLLVGSLPYGDEASAMARAYELTGDRLIALPDGEIGERSDQYPNGDRSQWVAGLAGRLAGETTLFDVLDPGIMNEQGFPVDFSSTTLLRPRCSPAELGERLTLGYDNFALRSWPHFERLRASAQNRDLRMQVGLPTGLGVAASVLKPARALRFAPAFATCLAREAQNAASTVGADKLLLQIEVPAEVVMAHRLPLVISQLAARPVVDLVQRLPAEVPVGLHLCFGDLNNRALIAPREFSRLVGFANDVLARWPGSHDLAYVHLPFAAGISPPPQHPGAYSALRFLDLPPSARVVAGLVHEQPELESLEELLRAVEAARGAPVDVACACGLGRRSAETADELIRRCRRLADTPLPGMTTS